MTVTKYPYHDRQVKGFTLVETLVAVLMISVVLVAVTTLMTRSLQAVTASKDFFVASKLALEGIEMVRVKRNNNLIASSPTNGIVWNSGMGNGSYSPVSTDINPLRPGNNLPGASEATLCLNSSGRYTYSCGSISTSLQGSFRRRVTISNTTSSYALVTVTVTWNSPRSPFTLSTVLFNAS
jgi:prepilin-type N-terminal cleavage/methylation domain-containing protein